MQKRILTPISWRIGGRNSHKMRSPQARKPQGLRRLSMDCERLEERVVLSHGGFGGFGGFDGPPAGLSGGLSTIGVLPGGDGGGGGGIGEHGGPGQGTQSTQLTTDLQKLRADLQQIAASSGVTIADLNALRADELAIVSAGFQPDQAKLQAAITELATAVASGADTSQAKTDFNAVFSGSSISQTALDQAFANLTQIIADSKISVTELQTIANDQAAIQADFGGVAGGRGLGFFDVLTSLGVATGPAEHDANFGGHGTHHGGPIPQSTQLSADLLTLSTDLHLLAAKSDVTISDLQALEADQQAISKAGFHPDHAQFQAATSELVTAVAAGTDTTQAQADFKALFAGSTVSPASLDASIADLTKAVADSKVTTSDLHLIAADRAAIKIDLGILSTTTGTSPISNPHDTAGLAPVAAGGTAATTRTAGHKGHKAAANHVGRTSERRRR